MLGPAFRAGPSPPRGRAPDPCCIARGEASRRPRAGQRMAKRSSEVGAFAPPSAQFARVVVPQLPLQAVGLSSPPATQLCSRPLVRARRPCNQSHQGTAEDYTGAGARVIALPRSNNGRWGVSQMRLIIAWLSSALPPIGDASPTNSVPGDRVHAWQVTGACSAVPSVFMQPGCCCSLQPLPP